MIRGNYTDSVTGLGTGLQIGTGILGVDLPEDIRDIVHDLTNWKWSWEHAGKTGLDAVGILPVVGALKYGDEANTLLKGSGDASKNLDTLRNGHLAGEVHPKTGIPFDSNGYPDFSGVAKAEVQIS